MIRTNKPTGGKNQVPLTCSICDLNFKLIGIKIMKISDNNKLSSQKNEAKNKLKVKGSGKPILSSIKLIKAAAIGMAEYKLACAGFLKEGKSDCWLKNRQRKMIKK
jgi:hypothetical protein